MAKWNECLKGYAPDGIVNYSYYGDWAGPADCCYSTATIGNSDVLKTEEYDPGAANSLNIQGEMVSTAAYYMNLRLMEYFGKVTGKDVKEYTEEKERVQKAYLEKWFDRENVCIGKNSQSECAVSLYVGILPEEYEAEIAEKMASAVVDAGMRITTANIAKPMLLDMITKYGYTYKSPAVLYTFKLSPFSLVICVPFPFCSVKYPIKICSLLVCGSITKLLLYATVI